MLADLQSPQILSPTIQVGRPRGTARAAGPSAGTVVGIAGAVVVVAGLIITLVVMSSRSGTKPGMAGNEAEKPANGEAEAGSPSLLDQLTGRDPASEVTGYPKLGPLMGPLLAPVPPRDTSAHEAHTRAMLRLIDRFNNALAAVSDVTSLRASASQFQSLSEEAKAEVDRFRPPFRMTGTEEALLAQRMAPEIRQSIDRCRTESKRIARIPGLGLPGTQLMSRVAMFSGPMEGRLRLAENFRPRTGPTPYAEVYVKIDDEGAEAVVRQQLGLLTDGSSGMQWTHSADWKKAAFRVWPVDDPEEFSRRIMFGKVTAVKGRTIFVAANAFTDPEVASAREALKAREIVVPANLAGAPEANDPKPPADADDLTKLLFELRSSNLNKRSSAVKKLRGMANNPDRTEEVTKELVALLQDSNGFFVKDVMLAMLNWKTEETVPILIRQLDSSDFLVRDETAKILGTLGDARAAEPMIQILKTNPFVVDSIRKLGSAAEPALIDGLTDSDPAVRRGVCDVLAQIGGKDALLAMMRLPADSDGLVRIKASQAMKQIQARVGPVSASRKDANPFKKSPGKANPKP